MEKKMDDYISRKAVLDAYEAEQRRNGPGTKLLFAKTVGQRWTEGRMYIRLTADYFLALWLCLGDILLCIIALRVIKICDLLEKRKKEDDSEPVHGE